MKTNSPANSVIESIEFARELSQEVKHAMLKQDHSPIVKRINIHELFAALSFEFDICFRETIPHNRRDYTKDVVAIIINEAFLNTGVPYKTILKQMDTFTHGFSLQIKSPILHYLNKRYRSKDCKFTHMAYTASNLVEKIKTLTP
jgi:hypothetical protein